LGKIGAVETVTRRVTHCVGNRYDCNSIVHDGDNDSSKVSRWVGSVGPTAF